MELQKTLSDRNKLYGKYKHHADSVESVIKILEMHSSMSENPMPNVCFHGLRMIVEKLHRAAYSPEYLDSWLDIAGYATLVHDHLKEAKNGSKTADV